MAPPGRLWLATLDFIQRPRRPTRWARTPIGYRLVLDRNAEVLFCATAPLLTAGRHELPRQNILDLFASEHVLLDGGTAISPQDARERVELCPLPWQRNIEPLRFERENLEVNGIKVERLRAVQLHELYSDWAILGTELDIGPRLYALRLPWIYRKGELPCPVTDGHRLSNDPVLDAEQGASAAVQFLPPQPFKFLTWKRHQAEILTALNQRAALIRAPIQDAEGRDLRWGSRKHGTGRKPEVSAGELLGELALDAAQVVAMMGRGSKSPVGARPSTPSRRVRPWGSRDEWTFRNQLDLELSAATLGVAGFDPFWDRYASDRPPHQSPRELVLGRAERYRHMRQALERRTNWTPGGLSAWMLRNVDFAWAEREALRRFRVVWLHEQRVIRARRRGADLGGRPWKIQNAINGRWSAWQFPDFVTAQLQTIRSHRRVGMGASPDDDYPDSQDWQERMLTGQMASGQEPEPDGETDDESTDDGAVLKLDGLTEEQLHQYLGFIEPAPGEPSQRDIENQARRREEFRHLATTFRTQRGQEWLTHMLRGHSPASASREMGESPATGRKRWLRLRERAQRMRARCPVEHGVATLPPTTAGTDLLVFIDERFDEPTATYVIGAVAIRRNQLGPINAATLAERQQPTRPLKKPFHWHRATPLRRERFLNLTIIAHNLSAFGIVKQSVTSGIQETAREACIERLVKTTAPNGVVEYVLDRRDTAGKVYLDNRSFGRFANAGVMPVGATHRMAFATQEPPLTIADAVVGVTLGIAGSLPDLAIIDGQLTRIAIL